jgi:predicted amidophosphoribosyltransferase
LILNFKKSPDKRGTSQWQYKDQAIRQAARIFRAAIKASAEVTFVPIPPSKIKGDPLYDDRMVRLLQAACENRHTDIRELLIQQQSTEPAHRSTQRLSPDELASLYSIDESLTAPAPATIVIVDDVLTTGSHFKAAKNLLASRFPDARIIGLFIARRVPKSVASEFEDLDSQ